MGMLSAIEIRLQDIEEQVTAAMQYNTIQYYAMQCNALGQPSSLTLLQLQSIESTLKQRRRLHALNIQLALQRLLGGGESLDTAGWSCVKTVGHAHACVTVAAAALVRRVGAVEMRDERAPQREAEAADQAAIMSDR